MKKDYRDLTIGKVYTNDKFVPMLRLSGLWLEELGFQCGGYVRVKCENGQIIITPNVEKEEEIAAEKEYLERETAKLQARFRREKGEIHAKYVAEKRIKYEATRGGSCS